MQHISILHTRALLVVSLLLSPSGCRSVASAVDAGTVKEVADKVAPVAGGPGTRAALYYLIARDGTICQVSSERYWSTSVGSEVRCDWRTSRAEAVRDTVPR